MGECGCYFGLDCTKISVCSSETVIEELQDRIEELQQQVDSMPCYLTWKGYTDNEGEPETCACQGIPEWDYCPTCKAAIKGDE